MIAYNDPELRRLEQEQLDELFAETEVVPCKSGVCLKCGAKDQERWRVGRFGFPSCAACLYRDG